LLHVVQSLLSKCGTTLDGLETEWSDVNAKLPHSIELAREAVDGMQVCGSSCSVKFMFVATQSCEIIIMSLCMYVCRMAQKTVEHVCIMLHAYRFHFFLCHPVCHCIFHKLSVGYC